jgi:hypothetical protein
MHTIGSGDRRKSGQTAKGLSASAKCVAYIAARHPDLPTLEIARHLETDICNLSLAEPSRQGDQELVEKLTETLVLLVSIARCYPGLPLAKAARIAGFSPLNQMRAADIR